jgi:hypothetical protein
MALCLADKAGFKRANALYPSDSIITGLAAAKTAKNQPLLSQ